MSTNDRYDDGDANSAGHGWSAPVMIGVMMGGGAGYSISMGYGVLHALGMAFSLGAIGAIAAVVYTVTMRRVWSR